MLSKILTFEYAFKVGTEIGWAGLIAAITFAYQTLTATDLASVLADPKTYGLALAAGVGRAAGVAALNALRAAIAKLLA